MNLAITSRLTTALLAPLLTIGPAGLASQTAEPVPPPAAPMLAQQALSSLSTDRRRLAQPEIRAIWLDRGTIVQAGSGAGLADVFDRLAAAGINTVFVETVNAGYPIYPSQVAPQQNPLTRGWDPLEAAIALGHERGIEVHAWVWVFAAGNQRHNLLVNQPVSYPGPVLAQHPDWAAYDNRGNLILPGQTKPFFDPANPEVRRYIKRLLSEIASNYEVDGIQLDYVRYPFQDPATNRTFGYGMAARLLFRQRTGVDPGTLVPPSSASFVGRAASQHALWDQWTEFRVEQISSFVAEAARELRQQRPDLIISAAVFAQSDYERRQVIQQDWNRWARQGDVDWIVLMSYARDIPQFEALIRPWTVEADYGETQIIPGIRLLSLSNAAALDQIKLLRNLPVSGYALFAAENLNNGLQAMLTSIQAAPAAGSHLRQEQPFATAAARYQTLQQEWNGLLAQQQLEMSPHRLEQWATETDALGNDLAALAADPSRRRVTLARARLRLLQNHLNSGFTLRMASAPSYLRTWQYYLTTIDGLLADGEDDLPP